MEKTFGARVDMAGVFKFSDRFFTEISLGYLFAEDTQITFDEEVKVLLGGLRAGVGLGLWF